MKTTINTTEDQLLRAVRRDKKSRSKRDRPHSTDELVSAISNSKLDGRTNHARHLVAVRESLANRPLEAALVLTRDLLALNSTVARRLIEEVHRPGFEILDGNGALHPVLSRHLPDCQKAIMQGTATLLKLEAALHPPARAGKADSDVPGETQPMSISDVILSLSDG